MIASTHKELAQRAMEYALKQGCQAARVTLYANANTAFELRNGEIDRLQQASENGLSIGLYVDGRFGEYSTNRMNARELETFIKQGIEATRYLAEDPARVLPDPSRYYKGGLPDLEQFDQKIDALLPDEKADIARKAAEEAIGKDDRIISVDSSWSDRKYESYRLTSNGFEGSSRQTSFSVYAGVSIRGEGEARPESGWSESSLFFDSLPTKDIGTKALERVLRKLGQRKVKSGKYTMVIDPRVATQVLSPVMSALSGSALQQKNSFLMDRIGQKVASDKLTLIDEPHLIRAVGARYFDAEGIATQRIPVFENGVLRTYYVDTYNAKKMNVEPTISGASLLVLQPGTKNLDELVKSVNKGIFVTGFNGGNSNSSTGDFSYGIEGFLIENGKQTQPVNEMNVTGNFVKLWSQLAEVGNDPRLSSSWRIPTLVFENVDFSGL
ncbi:MAG: TldD/PmbA family protein [Prevotellaceae bacterium]|jgi:PmbA protein|nr:TldD/PmbA family protein [Prevotellaceae bacterium]